MHQLQHIFGKCALVPGARQDFLPEDHRIAQLAQRHQSQPAVMFCKHEWAATVRDAVTVASLDGFARNLSRYRQMLFGGGPVPASDEPPKIAGIRRRPAFVTLAPAPHTPALQ